MNGKMNMLYCPQHKETKDYVTERYERTDDVFEAIGWASRADCLADIQNMDEPDEWQVAIKIITMMIIEESKE